MNLHTERYCQIHWANTVNQLMTSAPSLSHSRALASVAHRKYWLCHAGDALISPKPIPSHFREYANAILELDQNDVEFICPPGSETELLSNRIKGTEEENKLLEIREKFPDCEVSTFAQDNCTINYLQRHDLKHSGYSSLPNNQLLKLIYRLNSKSGFREVAELLNIPVPYGVLCNGDEALVNIIDNDPAFAKRAMIKFDRSSNGYGNTLFDRSTWYPLSTAEALLKRSLVWPEQFERYVVETCFDIIGAPSIEIVVSHDGPELLYNCDQRCINNSWRGMVAPPPQVPKAVTHEMEQHTLSFGRFVHSHGYRGICDVDFLLTENYHYYATETNFRRTGGTYLHELLARLCGSNLAPGLCWLADAQQLITPMDFLTAASLIRRNGFEFSRSSNSGILLVSDTIKFDGHLRYLIVGSSLDEISSVETELFSLVGM
ncbi:preATP grasp domain-containing protein [Aliiroseovarius sp. CAU 1755]